MRLCNHFSVVWELVLLLPFVIWFLDRLPWDRLQGKRNKILTMKPRKPRSKTQPNKLARNLERASPCTLRLPCQLDTLFRIWAQVDRPQPTAVSSSRWSELMKTGPKVTKLDIGTKSSSKSRKKADQQRAQPSEEFIDCSNIYRSVNRAFAGLIWKSPGAEVMLVRHIFSVFHNKLGKRYVTVPQCPFFLFLKKTPFLKNHF